MNQLLHSKNFRGWLTNLTDLALGEYSATFRINQYKSLTTVFCDGLEINLGKISKYNVFKTKSKLINEIHCGWKTTTVKHIMVSERSDQTFLWITFKPEASEVNSGFGAMIRSLISKIQTHAKYLWCKNNEQAELFCVTKIDFAQDYLGSFVTPKF